MAMKPNNKNRIPQANKIFTDREEPRKVFWDTYNQFRGNISNSQENEIKVITYYGIGGIGKTRLLRQISAELLDRIDKPLQVYIDLEDNSDMLVVLMKIKHLLQTTYQFDFPIFELAYFSYMQKQGNQITKEEIDGFISNSPILDSLLDISSLLPGTGTIIGMLKAIDNLNAAIRNKLKNRKRELNEIQNDDPDMLIKKMQYYLACDIENNLEGQAQPLVIFLDTYERLVNELASIGNPLDRDKWIRHEINGLVVNIPNTIWVIAGRDKLKWEQINPDWTGTLDHHLLGNLSDIDSKTFLNSAGITDPTLIDSIYQLTSGVPLYLDICVDRYHSMIEKGIVPTIKDLGSNTHELISRFVKYMDDNKKALIYLLSCLEDWTDDLLDKLVRKFLPGLPFTTVDNIKCYSFIVTENNVDYKMHNSIRDIIYTDCNKNVSNKVLLYMKEHYLMELQKLKITTLERAHLLKRYVHYVIKYGFEKEDDFIDFFNSSFIPHNEKLLKTYQFNESIVILETLIKYSHLNFEEGLAKTYCEMYYAMAHYFAGNYHIALENSLNAYDSLKLSQGESHQDTLKAMQLLIIIYRKIGEYSLSLSLSQGLYNLKKSEDNGESSNSIDALINLAISYRKVGNFKEALNISEIVYAHNLGLFGEKHPSTINAMSSLANAYRQSGDNVKACELSEKVVKLRTLIHEENNPSTLASMGSLAHSYRLLGKYEQSIELSEKVVIERSKILGEAHPLTIRAMNNLANSYRKVGKYNEGLIYAEKVYNYRLEFLGENHPATVGALSNLATSYRKLQQFKKAYELAIKVYQWRQERFGQDHPASLRAMNNLVNSYKKLGMIEEADLLGKSLISFTHKTYGPNHPSTLAAEHNLINEGLIDIDEEDSEDTAEEINNLFLHN